MRKRRTHWIGNAGAGWTTSTCHFFMPSPHSKRKIGTAICSRDLGSVDCKLCLKKVYGPVAKAVVDAFRSNNVHTP